MPDNPLFLTVPDVAALLRGPVSRVYEWTRRVGDDAIPRYRAGKRFVFQKDEVLAWFTETQRVGLMPRHETRRRLPRSGARRRRTVPERRKPETLKPDGTEAQPA